MSATSVSATSNLAVEEGGDRDEPTHTGGRRRARIVNIPRWLQVSCFILATTLTAAGVVAFFLRGSTSGSYILLVGAGLILYLLRGADTDSLDSYAEQIRERVDSAATSTHFNVQPGAVLTIEHSDQDPATVRAGNSLERQEAILREIYTQGLAQAKVSFRVSIFFASVGALFLLLGIGLAIFNAKNGGDQYASIVAGTAGVVVNLSSAVFFVQSNRARSNMGRQGVMLREESQEDRRLNAARELAGAINDEKLRNTVRADLARSLLTAPSSAVNESDEEAADESARK